MEEIYFEVVAGKEAEVGTAPERSTDGSAGYDFIALEDVTIPSMWDGHDKATIIPTGFKAKFSKNVVLKLFPRSSMAIKHGIILANGTGVIDSDYYGNENNDGEILFALKNTSRKEYKVKKGDKIGQGLFEPVLFITDDKTSGKERTGGIGSTGA